MVSQSPVRPAEKRIRLADANRHFANFVPDGRAGKPLHISTWIRWTQRGVRGVKLQSERCGGTLCTTEKWIKEFFEKLSGGGGAVDADASARQRAADDASAEAVLNAARI